MFYTNSWKCHLQDFERNIFILNKLWCGHKSVHHGAPGYFRIFIWPGPGERVPAISDSLRITQTHSFPFPTPIHPYLFDKCDSIDYKHKLYSALQKKGAARSLIRKRRFIGARTPAPTPASYGPHDGVFRGIADKGDGKTICSKDST